MLCEVIKAYMHARNENQGRMVFRELRAKEFVLHLQCSLVIVVELKFSARIEKRLRKVDLS